MGQRKHLNDIEFWRFLQAAGKLETLHDRLFCQVLIYTGCRISEALELTPSQIDRTDQVLFFRTLKQRGVIRYRAVPVNRKIIQSMLKLVSQQDTPDDQAIWQFSRTSAWKLVKECMDATQIKGVRASPKGLRHAFAVSCVECNIPITTLQKWLGHTKLETTSIYIHLSTKEERKMARRLWRTYNGISHIVFWLKNLRYPS